MILDKIRELSAFDAEIGAAVEAEYNRQRDGLELIASENVVSEAVLLAAGTILTNKYAEGYPGKRYYGGCEKVDVVETIAIERAKKLFGAQPGDTVLGMSLACGGHLTHGSPVNLSGKYYNFVPYGLNDEGFIDYDALEALAIEHQPKMIVAGASA